MSPATDFFQAISPFVSTDVRRSIEALEKIVGLFPGQSLVDVEKNVRTLLAGAANSTAALVERARKLVQDVPTPEGQTPDTIDTLSKDLSKRTLADLKAIAAGLSLPVKGQKPAVLAEIRQWLESKGTYVPKTEDDKLKDLVQEAVGDLPQRMGQMTPELAAEINRRAEEASKDKRLGAKGFQMFASILLGAPTKEPKGKLLQRIKAFVDRLVVSNAQTNSF